MSDDENTDPPMNPADLIRDIVNEAMKAAISGQAEAQRATESTVKRLADQVLHISRQSATPAYGGLAIQAMSYLINSGKTYSPEQLAKKAYDIADAMASEGEVRVEVRRRVELEFKRRQEAAEARTDPDIAGMVESAMKRHSPTLPVNREKGPPGVPAVGSTNLELVKGPSAEDDT